MHVTNLSHKHRRQGAADPGHLMDGPVAAVVTKPFRDAAVEQAFLGIESVDQLQ
ncbi:hypothetical protein RCR19_35085 [Streptomyces sp. WAC07094]|uniref:hypothetical protein n=1 Tax=Streptomyces sp. WAC07094 TaxID=3072183 RepID=UPI002EA91E64|nr:hypothetical protein [Streptomyces sp. WAC07094]